MSSEQPSRQQLQQLLQWDTPTIGNALESLSEEFRTSGFCGPEIRCLFPQLGRVIGFAATMQYSVEAPHSHGFLDRRKHWEAVQRIPAPRLVVAEDVDPVPGQAAIFGEVNSHIHRALGCVGLVTNGVVRDLQQVADQKFPMFAHGVCVPHQYAHYVSSGEPVGIAGLEVKPGDLLMGDEHGVIRIPLDLIDEVHRACQRVVDLEQQVIEYCEGDQFSVEGLDSVIRRSTDQIY